LRATEDSLRRLAAERVIHDQHRKA